MENKGRIEIILSCLSMGSHLGWKMASWQCKFPSEHIPFGVLLISDRALTNSEKAYAKKLTNLPDYHSLA